MAHSLSMFNLNINAAEIARNAGLLLIVAAVLIGVVRFAIYRASL